MTGLCTELTFSYTCCCRLEAHTAAEQSRPHTIWTPPTFQNISQISHLVSDHRFSFLFLILSLRLSCPAFHTISLKPCKPDLCFRLNSSSGALSELERGSMEKSLQINSKLWSVAGRGASSDWPSFQTHLSHHARVLSKFIRGVIS